MRNVLGLLAHNLLKHCDSKHYGIIDDDCDNCDKLKNAIQAAGNYWLSAEEIVAVQRRIEARKLDVYQRTLR